MSTHLQPRNGTAGTDTAMPAGISFVIAAPIVFISLIPIIFFSSLLTRRFLRRWRVLIEQRRTERNGKGSERRSSIHTLRRDVEIGGTEIGEIDSREQSAELSQMYGRSFVRAGILRLMGRIVESGGTEREEMEAVEKAQEVEVRERPCELEVREEPQEMQA